MWRILKNKERFPKTDRSLGLITKAFLLLILALVMLASWANNPLEYTGWGARETFALVATVLCLGAANSMINSAASKEELSELGPWDAAGLVGTVAGAAAALEIVTVALVSAIGRIID